MKKVLIIAGALLAVLLGAGVIAVFMFNQPRVDLSVYEPLRQPRISQKADEQVIEVVAKGAPKETAGKAIGLLFDTFFALKRQVDDLEMVPPKGRWEIDAKQPPREWVGHYAMKVPKSVKELPGKALQDGLSAQLATWSYGEVAEILHQGPYDAEEPTIAKLKAFIKSQRYEIAGPHEEEYLKGPGMFFAGDPAGYYTVIRYNVRKKAEPVAAP